MVWLAAPGESRLLQETVVAVEAVRAEGMFNPYTVEGARPSSTPTQNPEGPCRTVGCEQLCLQTY